MENYYSSHDRYKLYILELEGGYYYVGISTDPHYRFEQHKGIVEGGAEWTALHKPIRQLYISQEISYSERKSEKIEEIVTIEMMKLVGRDLVRGSHYSSKYQSTSDYYLGQKRIEEIDKAFEKNINLQFKTWSDKRIRRYFNNLIFEKQFEERQKEIKNNLKHGKKEYCGVKACVNNHYGRCSYGFSPWKDQVACKQKYEVRI